MPIYEYRCVPCGKLFERIEAMTVRRPGRRARCPLCHGHETERCWSRVAVETGRKSYHPAKPLDV